MAKKKTRRKRTHNPNHHLRELLEDFMATAQELVDKSAAIVTELQAVPKPVAPLATQEQLDSVSANLDAAKTAADALKPPTP